MMLSAWQPSRWRKEKVHWNWIHFLYFPRSLILLQSFFVLGKKNSEWFPIWFSCPPQPNSHIYIIASNKAYLWIYTSSLWISWMSFISTVLPETNLKTETLTRTNAIAQLRKTIDKVNNPEKSRSLRKKKTAATKVNAKR